MYYFLFGESFINCAPMREIRRPTQRGDNGANARLMAMTMLCFRTACGHANDLQDASDLARLVDTTPKQAQIVWDVCIKHGVLRQTPQGYSARPWMIERGILGDFERKHRKSEPQQSQQPQQPQYPSKSKNIF